MNIEPELSPIQKVIPKLRSSIKISKFFEVKNTQCQESLSQAGAERRICKSVTEVSCHQGHHQET